MKKIIAIIASFIIVCVSGMGVFFLVRSLQKETPYSSPGKFPEDDSPISRIGIGGGGAFLSVMIDPMDENVFYVTSDMGALYYSHDKGESWERKEARAVFAQTHMADNGVVFVGGNGVYASFDKGENLNLIYPKDVKYFVSRCGWNENLMLAEGYDNGYVKCIDTNKTNVFFVTIDWEGKLRLLRSDYDGENLEILYNEQTTFLNPMDDVEMHMLVVEEGLYLSFGKKICFFDFETKTMIDIYFTSGYIKDIEQIGRKIFFIDDLDEKSLILYTSDFVVFEDLMDHNSLTNEFTKYGREGTFNWHFKQISGNNFNNIYLSFSSPVNEFDDTVDGIMKFNGTEFEWVFDSMYKTRFVTEINGWSYGCHGPIYGICANPHDDNICAVANVETVYLMEYPNEENKKIKTLHCTEYGDGKYSTNGLDVQTTYFVKEDPFNKNHIIICTTDLGLQNSYDGGKTWQRMEITGDNYNIYNTCYDLYFDKFNKDVIYALWSSRHDAPYNPTVYDKDTVDGVFAVSRDGGITWDFGYSTGLPVDSIPVKMSISHSKNEFVIAVATFNRGFYLSVDGGRNFLSINEGIDTVEGLIFGEDIVLTNESIYCLVAPYLDGGNWKSAKFYEYDRNNKTITKVDLGDITLARSLTYHKEKGLFVNVIPTYSYKWFVEYDNGLWVNEYGGIYHYEDGKFERIFDNSDGIFYSAFAPDGKMYATDTYGKVFVLENETWTLLYEGLFNMLKNLSFSLDGEIMYVTTFGGGTYRIKL